MTHQNYINEIMIVNVQFSKSQNASGEEGPMWAEVRFRIAQPNGEDAYLVEQFQLDGDPDTLDELLAVARSRMSQRLATLSQRLQKTDS